MVATSKEITTTMTQRGQVTVPAEVRRLLGLKPRDKVAFAITNGEVKLSPAKFTLDTVFGSVPALKRKLSDKQLSKIVKDDRARAWLRDNK